MKQKIEWIKLHIMDILIWGTVAFFTLLYFSLIFNYNLCTDEGFTMKLVRYDLKEMIEATAADVHPPLHYIWTNLFYEIFGFNVPVMKVSAILPMVVLMIYLAVTVKKWFGDRAAFLTLLFICCIPCTMRLIVQIRMYSFTLLFVGICGISAYAAFVRSQKKDWLGLIIGAVGAAYTHYFAFVAVLFIIGYLFLAICIKNRKLLKAWLISVVCMLILYLPWFSSFIGQVTRVGGSYWIPEITPETVWGYFTWTFDLELVPGAVYGFLLILAWAVVWCIIRIAKKKEKEDIFALLCLLVPVATAGFGIIISLINSPIYRDQYITPSLIMLALFAGIILARADIKALIPVVAFLLFVGAVQYKENYREEYKSSYIQQTLDFMEENFGENDYILYNYKEMAYIYKLYFPEERMYYVEDFDLSSEYDNVWFFNTHNMWPITQNDLINNGVTMEFMGLYGIEYNPFDLYRVYHVEE